MNAVKKCLGAVGKTLVSWYNQITTCSFYELPEDFRMNKKVSLAAHRLGSCVLSNVCNMFRPLSHFVIHNFKSVFVRITAQMRTAVSASGNGNPHFIVSKRLCVSSVNAAECGRLYYIYSEIPRDVRGVVTVDTFVTFFRIKQVRTVLLPTVCHWQ